MTKELLLRLMIWSAVLRDVYRYLAIAGHFSMQPKEYVNIEIDGKSFSSPLAAEVAYGMRISAVVLFQQIYSSGNSGAVAANNQPELKLLRKQMEEYAITTLGIQESEFNRVMSDIKAQRDQRIAHFDGNAAKFEKITDMVSTMRGHGFRLEPQDLELFAKIVSTMCDFLQKEFVAAESR